MIHATDTYLLNPSHEISITLIGCGGSGSLMLSRLARLDYALKQFNLPGLQIKVFDDDKVEQHNIGRQMFGINDVGEYKCVTLVSKINRNFNARHEAVPSRFNCKKEEEKSYFNKFSNIYITCVDNVEFRIEFNEMFKKISNSQKNGNNHDKCYYWFDFGNAKNTGQLVVGSTFIEQKNKNNLSILPTIIDRYPNLATLNKNENQGNSCSYQSKLEEQNLFINDCLTAQGSHLLQELLITGYIDKGGFYMNLDSFKTNPIPL